MTNNHQNKTLIKKDNLYPITVVAITDTLLMDIAGPCQVFSSANQILKTPHYKTYVTTQEGKPVTTDTGIEISAHFSFDEMPPAGDIIIPGGPSIDANLENQHLLAYLREATKSQRRIISICSGSMLLAAAGLLDGKQATCHWTRTPMLFDKFPKVRWRPDEIFTKDGNTYCSAGVTAGVDLSLSLLEEDHGRNLALDVARELVVFMRRSGGQNQYSKPLKAQAALSSKIRELCIAITENPIGNWQLCDMEAFANMTERTLHRHFIKEFNKSPSRFVEEMRLDLARTFLDHGAQNLEEVAQQSGFKNEQTLRRAFSKYLNITPVDYRHRFGNSIVVV